MDERTPAHSLATAPRPPWTGGALEVAAYYDAVAQAFDAFAPGYEALHTLNPIMSWLRQESLALLQEVFPTESPLLELGCGTGYEALRLAAGGRRLVATDLSPRMIEVARVLQEQADSRAETLGFAQGDRSLVGHAERSEASPLSPKQPWPKGSVDFRVLPAHQLEALVEEFGPGTFAGAYSSFGALNCEPQMVEVARGLHTLLAPKSNVVVSVMNPLCLWEITWYLLHGNPTAAFRRFHGPWPVASLGKEGTVPVRYYSLRSLAEALAPFFAPERTLALGVFVPPPYLAGLAERFPECFRILQSLERRLRGRWPFPWLGDHVAVVFRRQDG